MKICPKCNKIEIFSTSEQCSKCKFGLPENQKGSFTETDNHIIYSDLNDIDRIMHPNIEDHYFIISKQKKIESNISDDPDYFNPWL